MFLVSIVALPRITTGHSELNIVFCPIKACYILVLHTDNKDFLLFGGISSLSNANQCVSQHNIYSVKIRPLVSAKNN